MIDINVAKKAFKEYVKKYNPKNKRISLKISHIERTSSIAKDIAQKLELENEDIKLAELIGLLHDIGRFEQVKRYNTFIDKDSINHAKCGSEVLFEQGLIEKFVQDRGYDDIIKAAILNHNKPQIEEGLNQKQKLYSKIIRDADKTDIFYTLTFEDTKAIYEKYDFSNDKITEKVYKEFKINGRVDYNNIQTSADILVAHFAYLYDFNYKYGLQHIYEKGYIDKLYNKFKFNNKETMQEYNNIYKLAKQYVEEKLGSGTSSTFCTQLGQVI